MHYILSAVSDTTAVRPRSNLRQAGWVAGALLLWAVAMVVAGRVLDDHPSSVWLRGAMVAAAVGGFSAWVAALVRFLQTQDEFAKRVHLIALALAFMVTMTAMVAGDVLQAAGFIGDVSLDTIWMTMLAVWWLSMIAAARYYR